MNPVVEMLNGARPAGTHWDDCPKYHYACAAIKEIERLEAQCQKNLEVAIYLLMEQADSDWVEDEVRPQLPAGLDDADTLDEHWIDAVLNANQATLEAELQRRSFAFGNANLDNPNVTQQMVDDAAEEK